LQAIQHATKSAIVDTLGPKGSTAYLDNTAVQKGWFGDLVRGGVTH
jgi:hypothetical protein